LRFKTLLRWREAFREKRVVDLGDSGGRFARRLHAKGGPPIAVRAKRDLVGGCMRLDRVTSEALNSGGNAVCKSL